MLYTDPQYRVMGDRALLVELGNEVDLKVNNRVRELFVAIKTDPLEGVVETMPSYRSLLLIFDPLKTTLSLLQTGSNSSCRPWTLLNSASPGE